MADGGGFGERIRVLREQKKWTQEKLGDEAGGLSRDTINRAEQSENVRINTLYQIATALDVPILRLFGVSASSDGSSRLPKDESDLLRLWKRLSQDQRAYLQRLMKNLADEPAEK